MKCNCKWYTRCTKKPGCSKHPQPTVVTSSPRTTGISPVSPRTYERSAQDDTTPYVMMSIFMNSGPAKLPEAQGTQYGVPAECSRDVRVSESCEPSVGTRVFASSEAPSEVWSAHSYSSDYSTSDYSSSSSSSYSSSDYSSSDSSSSYSSSD